MYVCDARHREEMPGDNLLNIFRSRWVSVARAVRVRRGQRSAGRGRLTCSMMCQVITLIKSNHRRFCMFSSLLPFKVLRLIEIKNPKPLNTIPEEECDLSPRKVCKPMTKLVPSLKSSKQCTQVSRQINTIQHPDTILLHNNWQIQVKLK